mgnify:CR=1 FL=1
MDKTIAYCRISSFKQSNNTSLEYQSEKCRDYSKLYDLNLVDVLTEIDSGGNDDRVVFNHIQDLIKVGKINTLLVWKLDRLSRSMLGGLKFIQYCKDYNCRVICVNEGLDTSNPKSELMLNIFMSIATEERRIIKERCQNGLEMKWNQNQIPYSKLSFGYKRKKDGKIVPNQDSEIVKYIFKKYNELIKNPKLTKTKRTQKILRLLNHKGFRYYGKHFKNYHIKQILNNKFYIGVISWKGEEKKSPYETIISKRLYNQIHSI